MKKIAARVVSTKKKKKKRDVERDGWRKIKLLFRLCWVTDKTDGKLYSLKRNSVIRFLKINHKRLKMSKKEKLYIRQLISTSQAII